MTNKKLRKLCTVWQKRLRLQDWTVSVEFVGGADIDGSFARTRKSGNCKAAKTLIARPETLELDLLGSHDVEVTLVHELLHLQAGGFDQLIKEDTVESTCLEAFIELTAAALVKGYRR